MIHQPRRAMRLITGSLALYFAVLATEVVAQEKLQARILEPFETPSVVSLDPLDDNDEMLAAVAVIEDALEKRGISIQDDADYVLEIEVDPTAYSDLSQSWREDAADRIYMDKQRGNSVNELAPSAELAPESMERPKPGRYALIPELTLTILLYKRGEPPVWMAQAHTVRNNRPVNSQIRSLAALAMMRFTESASIGFKGKDQDDVRP